MKRAFNIPGLRREDASLPVSAIDWRRLCALAVKMVIVLVAASAALAQQQPQMPQQAAPSDPFIPRRAEAEAAHEGHRAKLFVDLAREEMEAADHAFTDGRVDAAQKLVADVGKDADSAKKAAVDSGKRLKETELDLGKLERRTRDIGRSLNFEDRPPLEKLVQRIQEMRQAILDRMFSGKKKGKP